MLHAVPLAPGIGILQPEVCGQVDKPHATLQQFPGHAHRDTVRGGEEHQIAGRQHIHVRFGERQIDVAAKIGKQIGYPGTGLATRGNRVQLHIRMQRQQTQQLNARIPGTADHTNFRHNPTRHRCASRRPVKLIRL